MKRENKQKYSIKKKENTSWYFSFICQLQFCLEHVFLLKISLIIHRQINKYANYVLFVCLASVFVQPTFESFVHV